MGAAADAVEPLAGESGEQAGTLQEPGAVVCCGDGGPQVSFAVIPEDETNRT